MKRFLVFAFLLASLITPFGVNAQMDNLANMSAKWIRSNTRNAALEGTDIVNYNPAGLVKLNDGFHISLNNQTLFRKPQHSFTLNPLLGKQTAQQDGNDPFLPSLYAAFKKGKLAVSSGTYITGGGASADYPSGSINTNLMGYSFMAQTNATYGTGYTQLKDQSLKASSYYIAVPLNISYSITNNISVSLGGRYIIANNSTKAGMTFAGSTVSAPNTPISIDYKNEARGFGGIIGVNYSVSEKMNVAIHYETKVKLEFEAKDNKGSNKTLVPDGTKTNRDLPAVLYTGLSYKFNDKISGAVDFNYYFQKNADWGTTTDPRNGKKPETSDIAGNCYHVALGVNYQIMPKLQISAGGKYIHFGYSDQELYYTQLGAFEAVKYDNYNVGIGAGYKVTEKIQLDLGVGRTIWKDKDIKSLLASGAPVSISNKAYVIALGIDIAF